MPTHRLPQLNTVTLVGRLTCEPDMKLTESGKVLAVLRLAANHKDKDAAGQWQQDTTFVSVVAWEKTAEAVSEHLSTGSAVLVEGRLKSSVWERADQTQQTSLEIVARTVQFLDSKPVEEEQVEAVAA